MLDLRTRLRRTHTAIRTETLDHLYRRLYAMCQISLAIGKHSDLRHGDGRILIDGLFDLYPKAERAVIYTPQTQR